MSRPVQSYHKLKNEGRKKKRERETNGIAIKDVGFNGLGTGINLSWLEQIAKHTLAGPWSLLPTMYSTITYAA